MMPSRDQCGMMPQSARHRHIRRGKGHTPTAAKRWVEHRINVFFFLNLDAMNARLHSVLKYLYAVFLLASGIKHLYNIYWGDASIMATGYPEPEATAFVFAVLETKFCSPSSAPPDRGGGDRPSRPRAAWGFSWPSLRGRHAHGGCS